MTTPSTTRREMIWVLLWAILIMLLTCIPYFYGLKLAAGRTFSGFIWGVDEGNVYLTWMRQAAEGDVFFRNQYAVAPENPRFFNLYLQFGGRLSALLNLRPIILFHVLRLLGGIFLLVSFYRLTAEITCDRIARWSALTLASLGSGFGWLIVMKYPQSGLHPVDVGQGWQVQPEAVTFPSLLLNGLFTTSMALMCLTFLYAIRALRDDDRKAIWWGGLCLLVLGNIHTYDVFPVWLALLLWTRQFGYCAIGERKILVAFVLSVRTWGQTLWKLAPMVLLGLPSVLWALYATFADPAFLAKGLTRTPAFRFVDYVVAYGLIGLLALLGAVLLNLRMNVADRQQGSRAAVQFLPTAWVVATIIVLLIPVSFQRKMIEGLHLPLCILAGLAVSWLAALITTNLRRQGKRKHAMERLVLTVCAVTVFCIPSNALFVSHCLQSVKTNNEQLLRVLQPPIYLDPPIAQAMQWLGPNTTSDDIIVSSSLMGSYIPTYCPAKVWVGHWAETIALKNTVAYLDPKKPAWEEWEGVLMHDPDSEVGIMRFADQLQVAGAIFALKRQYSVPSESDDVQTPSELLQQLQSDHITMVYYSPWEQAMGGPSATARWSGFADASLQKVYDQGGVRIYRVPQETR